MKFIIDRIENGIAVCLFDNDGRVAAAVSVALLDGMGEGDIFEAVFDGDAGFSEISFLKEETELRRAEIKNKLNRLFGHKHR